MRTISTAYSITRADAPAARAQAFTLDGGTITAVGPASGTPDNLFALPALTNSHDHGRAVRPSSIGASDKPLESWLNYLGLFPSVDPYLAGLVTYAHTARGGVGTVVTHYTRTQGFTDMPTEVSEMARAARDVGIRVGFAISLKDRNPLVYGASEPILAALPDDVRGEIESRFMKTPLKPHEMVALVEAVAAAAHSPNFDVQFGPNGVQWCSNELLAAIADASARTGRHIHMHLLETRYQREWLDRTYPEGGVKFLDSIGLLSPRLTLAHCVHARPDELELIAARGCTIAANHSSNLHLRSGIPPVQAMLKAGCNVALGIDASAFDEDDDAVREMRVARLLQVGNGYDVRVKSSDVFRMAFCNGYLGVMNKAREGKLEAGEPADLLLLDWSKVDDEALRTDIDPVPILFARATAQHIDELIIGGKTIVKQGQIKTIDYPAAREEVLARMRVGLKNAPYARALVALDKAVEDFYHPADCC